MVKNAKSVKEVLEARDSYVEFCKEFAPTASLSYMCYTTNTVDKFYLAENDYYDEINPKVQNYVTLYSNAILDSPFRTELEKELSPMLFKLFEVQRKAMSPEIIEEMVEENKLVTEYSNLMAGMTFEFKGETMSGSVMMKK